jgi:hypothetical protein
VRAAEKCQLVLPRRDNGRRDATMTRTAGTARLRHSEKASPTFATRKSWAIFKCRQRRCSVYRLIGTSQPVASANDPCRRWLAFQTHRITKRSASELKRNPKYLTFCSGRRSTPDRGCRQRPSRDPFRPRGRPAISDEQIALIGRQLDAVVVRPLFDSLRRNGLAS